VSLEALGVVAQPKFRRGARRRRPGKGRVGFRAYVRPICGRSWGREVTGGPVGGVGRRRPLDFAPANRTAWPGKHATWGALGVQ
jgi:hypothetical protein